MLDPDNPRPLCGRNKMGPRRRFHIGTVDCETHGLDGKAVYVTCYDEVTNCLGEFYKWEHWLDYMLSMDPKILRRMIWYSHNGEYDWRYLVVAFKKYANKYKIIPHERATNILYGLTIQDMDGKLITKFRDSLAIFPRKLKEFAEAFAKDTSKGEIDFDGGEIFDVKNPDHRDYAKQDVICLAKALQNFDIFIYLHYGVHLSATASGTAYQAWLRTIDETPHWRQSPKVEAELRHSYVGGMVQLNCQYMLSYMNVHCYDINSSYPASMRLGVPVGRALNTIRYKEGHPGFYKIRFKVREDFIMPVLAVKDPKGLCFPVGGWIDGYASSLEIDYARSLGYQIRVEHGYWFPDGLMFLFNDYVDRCEELRLVFKSEPPEMVIKQMQNSLYGRFGMKPEGRVLQIDYTDELFGEDGPNGPWGFMIDENTGENIPHLFAAPEIRSTEYMQPHWAAWITANSRILLDRGARAAGIEHVLYRDTDSLYVVGAAPSLDIGPAYVQWKLEKIYPETRFHAPKAYTWIEDNSQIGAKFKGMPRKHVASNVELRKALHEGVLYKLDYHRSNKMLTFLKTEIMGIECTRHQTRAEKVYSHILINGKFVPRRLG